MKSMLLSTACTFGDSSCDGSGAPLTSSTGHQQHVVHNSNMLPCCVVQAVRLIIIRFVMLRLEK
jgi:hypothetical protein